MTRSAFLAAGLAIAAMLPLQGAVASASDPSLGVWRNPKNSVHVKTYNCGQSLCGTVVWASAHQQEAAREAGTPQLIGKQMFGDLTRRNGQSWRGQLFVPKQGKMFPGTVTMVDADTMEVRGCALGGLICRSQTWTRLPSAS